MVTTLFANTVPSALLRYRIMAWIVGTMLLILTTGVILKYAPTHFGALEAIAGPIHGFLYMALIITAVDLGLRVKWNLIAIVLIALAGTIPFLSFVAEHFATRSVRAWLAAGAQAPASRADAA